jgi:ABC-type uncharacterized transport system permease subunit
MSSVLFAAIAVLYFVAGAIYLAHLIRGTEGLARIGTWTLAVAAVAHLALLGTDLYAGAMSFDIHEALAAAALLLTLAFLAAARGRPKMQVVGAFVTPVTLLFFLGAGLRRGVGTVPPEVRSAVLPLHVTVNVLGVVAFALAFGVALAYLLQERQLRRKQLGGIFQRLPPLDVLDTLGFRLVTIGFPLLTLGVVSGALWAVRIDPDAPSISPTQMFGLVAWVMFAGVLLLRVAAGWRGRRAAYGTMLGFLCTCLLLAGYVLRDGSS